MTQEPDYCGQVPLQERYYGVEESLVDRLHVLGLKVGEGETFEEVLIKDRKLEVEKNPDKAYNHSDLGDAYFKNGELDKAIQCYEKALELDPDNSSVYHGLGIVQMGRGNHDEGIKNLEKAVEINPEHGFILHDLGVAHIQNGNYDEAIKHLEKARELEAGHILISCNLGIAYYKKGIIHRAETCFSLAGQFNKYNLIFAHLNLSVLYREEGKENQANYHLGVAKKLNEI